MGTRAEIHDRVLAAKSVEDLMSAYDEWASNYDHDLNDEWGYLAPKSVADLVAAQVSDRTARILDAGCGTGLVGLHLSQKGFERIDGADYSEAMLDQAKAKQVYQNLMRLDLNGALPIEDGAYDLVTCVGTFTSSHVVPEALVELVRVTRAGGIVCFTVRDSYWDDTGFLKLLADLEQGGTARLKELRTELYIGTEGSYSKVVLLEVR